MYDYAKAPGDPVPDITVPFPLPTTLNGTYTSLVPLSPSHAPSLHAHLGGPSRNNLWTYLPTDAPPTPEATTALITQWTSAKDPQYYVVLSGPASDPASEPVGIVAYLAIFPDNRRIEIGWVILGEALQRTREATEAFSLMMGRAFELGYQRVEWKANSMNAPSLAAAERLGFTYEGTFRKHVVWKGKRRDTAWYSITDEEWPVAERGFKKWLNESNFDSEGKQKRTLKECRESSS